MEKNNKLIKIYVFYKGGDMCAFTTNKDLAKEYSLERPQCKKKIIKVDEENYKIFATINNGFKLFTSPLTTSNDETINMVITYRENDTLEDYLTAYYETAQKIISDLCNLPLKKKVKKLLKRIGDSLITEEGCLRFDDLTIFIRFIANYDIHESEE